jgi:hypothetical protein
LLWPKELQVSERTSIFEEAKGFEGPTQAEENAAVVLQRADRTLTRHNALQLYRDCNNNLGDAIASLGLPGID